MTHKAFVVSLALIGVLIAFSATPGVGAIIGLFFGSTAAFFVGPAAILMQWIIDQAGVPIKLERHLNLLLSMYGACVLFALYRSYRSFSIGDRNKARSITAKAVLFAALPIAAYFSLESLAEAWP